MLQTLQDFALAIADDFGKPDVAVDLDEECALVDADGLSVTRNDWIYDVIPNLQQLGFVLTLLEPDGFENLGQDVPDGLCVASLLFFQGLEIPATPRRQDALACRAARRPFGGDMRKGTFQSGAHNER